MTDQRIDWFRILADLKRLGFSQYAVAEKTGIARETVRDWFCRTKEPRHSAGERLIAFWMAEMERPRESLPMFDPFDSMSEGRECLRRQKP